MQIYVISKYYTKSLIIQRPACTSIFRLSFAIASNCPCCDVNAQGGLGIAVVFSFGMPVHLVLVLVA